MPPFPLRAWAAKTGNLQGPGFPSLPLVCLDTPQLAWGPKEAQPVPDALPRVQRSQALREQAVSPSASARRPLPAPPGTTSQSPPSRTLKALRPPRTSSPQLTPTIRLLLCWGDGALGPEISPPNRRSLASLSPSSSHFRGSTLVLLPGTLPSHPQPLCRVLWFPHRRFPPARLLQPPSSPSPHRQDLGTGLRCPSCLPC